MALKIVYIAEAGPQKKKDRKLSAKELLHREALAAVAARYVHDEAKATKMFSRQRQELSALIEKRNLLLKDLV